MDKAEMQRTCDHAKATVNSRQEETTRANGVTTTWLVQHMHCLRCGMFFSRAIRKDENEEQSA